MTPRESIFFSPPPTRASDADRERSLRELRGHWMAGRLSLEEYEERCGEATSARYLADLAAAGRELPAPAPAPAVAPVPPQRTGGVAALSLGITGLVVLVFSMGLLFVVSLPLSVSAWALGRAGRARAHEGGGSVAVAGEVLGIVGTVFGCLVLTACAVIVA